MVMDSLSFTILEIHTCVDKTIVLPFFSLVIKSQVDRLAPGSIPLVGSSSNTTLLPPISAIPTDNFRFIPPESVCDCACLLFSSMRTPSIRSISASTCSLSTPFSYVM